MKNFRPIPKTLLFLVFILTINPANSEITALQQQVLDDYKAMIDMTPEQRKAYRATIHENKSTQERKDYTKAFKQVRPIMTEYLGVSDFPNKSQQSQNTNKQENRIPATNITYDTGVVFGGNGAASQMLGNRFDSALNNSGTACCFPVESTGSITMITFNMINTQFSSAVYSIYSNIMATTAVQVTSMGISVMTGLNTVAVSNSYSNGSFAAGIWQFNPTSSTALAVDTNSVGGQGFHALSLNDGANATMLTSIAGQNAIFRVSGNVATPVELINFTIE
jgi:hypothetical protein